MSVYKRLRGFPHRLHEFKYQVPIRVKVIFGHPMYLPPYAVAHDTWCDGVVFHSSARSHHILQSDGETASFPLPPLDKYMPDLAAMVGPFPLHGERGLQRTIVFGRGEA